MDTQPQTAQPQTPSVPQLALGTPNPAGLLANPTGAPASAPASASPTGTPQGDMASNAMNALGGGKGAPGDWAKAIVAGGLQQLATPPVMDTKLTGNTMGDAAAMMNEKAIPGASPAATAIIDFNKARQERAAKQQQADNAAKQQAYENKLKYAQLSLEEQKASVQIAADNARLAESSFNLAEAKKRAPLLEEQDRMTLRANENAMIAAQQAKEAQHLQHMPLEDRKKYLESPEYTNFTQLNSDQRSDLATGNSMAIAQGDGSFKVMDGARDTKQGKSQEPTRSLVGYTYDKKGLPQPQYESFSSDTPQWVIDAAGDAAQKDLDAHNKQIEETGKQAETQQRIATQQAQERHENAETIKANAGEWKIDPTTGQMYNDRMGQYKLDQGDSHVVPWAPKVGEGEKQKTTLAEMVGENGESLKDILQRRPDLVGRIAGRYTSFDQMIGDNDPDIQRMGTAMQNLAKASVGIHGMRSYVGVEAAEKTLLNGFKNGANAVNAAVDEQEKSAQVQIDNTRTNKYGTHSDQGGVGKYYHRMNNAAPKGSDAAKVHQSMADFSQPKSIGGQMYYSDGKGEWYRQDGSLVKAGEQK